MKGAIPGPLRDATSSNSRIAGDGLVQDLKWCESASYFGYYPRSGNIT